MTDNMCSYQDHRGEMIVAYLYDDISASDRASFERHLAACGVCRGELDELRAVRRDMAAWAPPELDAIVTRAAQASSGPPVPRRFGWAREIPAWAQAAAAMLCLGAGAGLANLHVTYNGDGLTVRTGWIEGAAVTTARSAAASAVARPVTQTELTALEQQLRAEWQSARTIAAAPSIAAPSTSDEEIVRRVRTMIRDSEQRQQRELALRIAEEARDRQMQRQADLVKIDRTLGVLSNNTGMAVRRQEQLLNNLAVRVSQRQ
jgi:anti-sigma factor RsiW